MGQDFQRPPDGFRYEFKGMKTNSTPDAMPPGKYAMAVNVRATGSTTVQTRPGLVQSFATAGNIITDIRAYTAIGTGGVPRLLARDAAGNIFLDNGVAVGSLAGGGGDAGVAMIPFRPGASPSPWMYIAGNLDYQKFSAPSATNVVTQQKVGIAEPQAPPDAVVTPWMDGVFATPANNLAGNATAFANGTRFTDTIEGVFLWPTAAAGTIYTLQVNTGVSYQRYQAFNMSGGSFGGFVLDVYQNTLNTINIQGIYYYSGTTGKCVVVPANLGLLPDTSAQAAYPASFLNGLRRGQLVKIGMEVCFVLDVIVGPGGAICFETITTGAHTTSDTITGVPCIQVCMVAGTPTASATISFGYNSCQITPAGIGTATSASTSGGFLAAGGVSFQADDYLVLGLQVDNFANLIEAKLLFDVGDGSFTQNFYYYTIRLSDIAGAFTNTLTQLAISQTLAQHAVIDEEQAVSANNQGQTTSSAQLTSGDNQWATLLIPISALTRVGDDQTLTLNNTNLVQLLWNVSAPAAVFWSDCFVVGGGQVDVGPTGAPVQYRVRGRSTLTGVVGNPSPANRYGLLPRRQNVLLTIPAATDPQVDTWDVFRYGGAVTDYRYIGSTPASTSAPSTFTDSYDDASAQAGESLDFDNFEPWPSVDLPNNGTASIINGSIAVVTSTNPNITSYLPGTEVILGGNNSYTLWTRPTSLGGTSYLLQFVENAGASTNTPFNIQEPFLANQHLPYVWGPDAQGTVFAVGDAYRPGTVNFAKNYAPDSVPDSFNQEISPPSEILLGGEVLDGLSFVASPERWWALYPQPQDARQRYSVIQQPFPRGLAGAYGHCNDGQSIYWWAKDGIYSSTKGCLTDADLYNLFPHEGIPGQSYAYGGLTVNSPDYSRSSTFRLAYANGFLYATYQVVVGGLGVYCTIVYDTRRDAWCMDQYGVQACAFYHPEQPAGALGPTPALYPELIVANVAGVVSAQAANVNDNTTPISCALATGEFDGGDLRAPKQWGDFFMDLVPAASAGVSATPYSQGVGVAGATVVPTSTLRIRTPISVGGVVISDFLGLLATWTDDFSMQSAATQLFAWQPSFVVQPARTIAWFTFGTSYGIGAYMHLRQLEIAYVSTAPITLTITSYDGMSPAQVTLPSTGGQYQKTLFPVSANKGQLYKFSAVSSEQFQIFAEDSEIYIGAWGRGGPYATPEKFGGMTNAASPI